MPDPVKPEILPPDVPEGMMQMWDPVGKKIVIAGPELTIDRLRPFITAARFNIGDIVSFPAFGPELYAVSDIDDDGTIQIYNSGVKGLVAPSAVRGLRPYQITPAFPPGKFL